MRTELTLIDYVVTGVYFVYMLYAFISMHMSNSSKKLSSNGLIMAICCTGMASYICSTQTALVYDQYRVQAAGILLVLAAVFYLMIGMEALSQKWEKKLQGGA